MRYAELPLSVSQSTEAGGESQTTYGTIPRPGSLQATAPHGPLPGIGVSSHATTPHGPLPVEGGSSQALSPHGPEINPNAMRIAINTNIVLFLFLFWFLGVASGVLSELRAHLIITFFLPSHTYIPALPSIATGSKLVASSSPASRSITMFFFSNDVASALHSSRTAVGVTPSCLRLYAPHE